MSKEEIDRLELVQMVVARRLSVTAAAEQAGIGRQRMSAIVNAYCREGACALASRKRGKPANNKLKNQLRCSAVSIVRERYADFGPTLAAEYLADRHGIEVSRETLRKWMVEDGLWTTRKARRKRVQQRRARRECRGELV